MNNISDSNIIIEESTIQTGSPIECYKFTHNGLNYMYTSAAEDIEIPIIENGITRTEKYAAEVVKRDNILPGDTETLLTCKLSVHKDNAVAKLFQGPPPEIPVFCKIYRAHMNDLSKFDIVLNARISEASFSDSECSLTANQESWLEKELPNGLCQYYCNHTLFDHNCGLNIDDFKIHAFVDHVENKTEFWSSQLANYADGYFEGGKIYYNNSVRLISYHKGNIVRILYPFVDEPHNDITVVPGCNLLFRTCAQKYKNTINFGGVPYVAPTDPEKNPTGKGAYWQDDLIVKRDTDGFIGTITGL